jgi:probable addiction module antidote protein
MKKIFLRDYDPANYIKDADTALVFIKEAVKQKDYGFLLSTLGIVARSQGMSKLAKSLKLNRESLYKSFSKNGNPSFMTVVKLLEAIGFDIEISPKPQSKRPEGKAVISG